MGRAWTRAVAVAVLALLVAAPPVEAKFRIGLRLGDATPAVGQSVTVAVRAGVSPSDAATLELRLLAVPPGVAVPVALTREERYAIVLGRRGSTWRGVVRFSRPGRWRLVVPNWGAPGYAIPPPIVRPVVVSR